jgi:hypothetical protein
MGIRGFWSTTYLSSFLVSGIEIIRPQVKPDVIVQTWILYRFWFTAPLDVSARYIDAQLGCENLFATSEESSSEPNLGVNPISMRSPISGLIGRQGNIHGYLSTGK